VLRDAGSLPAWSILGCPIALVDREDGETLVATADGRKRAGTPEPPVPVEQLTFGTG
jgi:hypothetical protein